MGTVHLLDVARTVVMHGYNAYVWACTKSLVIRKVMYVEFVLTWECNFKVRTKVPWSEKCKVGTFSLPRVVTWSWIAAWQELSEAVSYVSWPQALFSSRDSKNRSKDFLLVLRA